MSNRSSGTSGRPLHAVIVGGSLAGLVTTLALAREGLKITVLERSRPDPSYGGGLELDAAQLERVTGFNPFGRRSNVLASWATLRASLREAAEAYPLVTVHHRTQVVDVTQDDKHAWATTVSGDDFVGDLLLGADGYGSFVRRHVAPEQPTAEYAGYVVWLGMVDVSSLSYSGRLPAYWDMLRANGDILFGIPILPVDGQTGTSGPRIAWHWYDATRSDLLSRTGAVVDGVVQHSVRPADIPQQTFDELARAAQMWPRPWQDAILRSVADHNVLGTPVAEYVPPRLVKGRIAIVGNAAHVPSPITGQGFDSAVRDAQALSRLLRTAHGENVPSRLADYESVRLGDVRHLVLSGQSFSRSFAA